MKYTMKENDNGTVTIPIERYHNLYALENAVSGFDLEKKVIILSTGGYYNTATYIIINPDDLEVKLKEQIESKSSEIYLLQKKVDNLQSKSKVWFEYKQSNSQIIDNRNWFQKLFNL